MASYNLKPRNHTLKWAKNNDICNWCILPVCLLTLSLTLYSEDTIWVIEILHIPIGALDNCKE